MQTLWNLWCMQILKICGTNMQFSKHMKLTCKILKYMELAKKCGFSMQFLKIHVTFMHFFLFVEHIWVSGQGTYGICANASIKCPC